MPNRPGHNWANAIAMTTPITHQGTSAGAKLLARTMIDLLTKAELVTAAWTYFRDVQTKDKKHTSLLANTDLTTTELNTRIRETYRPQLEKVYRDPTRYDTYLEQLGITYSTVRKAKPATTP